MAEEAKKARKPRIRKTAPTVRERVETASAKAVEEKPRRVRKAFSAATSKVPRPKVRGRLHLPDNRFFQTLRKIFRPFGKVLSKLAPRYFVYAWRELRQVTWPNRGETWRLTLAVFVFSIVFGALVAGVDKGLDEIFKHVVLK
ncbi:MAG TPA: preprotein translocase subunit SecE [Candidatus Saccharimonadales bacterium]|nr:preprotein translocase subunit SecE [Candidatus Saccharimonadales bacterium]